MKCLKGSMITRVFFTSPSPPSMCICPHSSYAGSCQLTVSCSVLVSTGVEVSTSSLRERACTRSSCLVADILYAEGEINTEDGLGTLPWSLQVRLGTYCPLELHHSVILFCAWFLCGEEILEEKLRWANCCYLVFLWSLYGRWEDSAVSREVLGRKPCKSHFFLLEKLYYHAFCFIFIVKWCYWHFEIAWRFFFGFVGVVACVWQTVAKRTQFNMETKWITRGYQNIKSCAAKSD